MSPVSFTPLIDTVGITKRRALLIAASAVLAFTLSLLFAHPYGGDLALPLCSARALLYGQEPYTACTSTYRNAPSASYPLPALLALMPFATFPDEIAKSLVWSISTALLAYAILRKREYHRLWFFASGAYWMTFACQQWGVLILAIALLPGLLPLALVKPQIGLPVILTRLTQKRLDTIAVFIALTFVVYPAWPFAWLAQARHYDGFIPLLVFPLLALPLLRWRDPDSLLYVILAAMPQRLPYDLCALWVIPRNLRQSMLLSLLSWGAVIPIYYLDLTSRPEGTIWYAIVFLYLPCLVMLARNKLGIYIHFLPVDRSVRSYIGS